MSRALRIVGRLALVGWIGRNILGLFTAGPVLWAMYQKGGPLMAVWILVCCVAGCVLTTLVPVVGWRLACRLGDVLRTRAFVLRTAPKVADLRASIAIPENHYG
jgi:hypothetical protein